VEFGPRVSDTGVYDAVASVRGDNDMATETPKCEKCGQHSRRIGTSKQKGKIVAHLACSVCGHGFTVKLAE